MKILKRLLCGVAVAGALCAPAVAADSYPSQPITLVNPYAAGGPADVLGRALARELEKQLGKTIIVENKAGGGAAIGANFVARAKPDGYTLLLGTSAAHVVTPLMQQTPYDGIKDFAFVSIVANQPNMLVVRPTLKADSVEQLIAMARKEPGRINYASAGPGRAARPTWAPNCSANAPAWTSSTSPTAARRPPSMTWWVARWTWRC